MSKDLRTYARRTTLLLVVGFIIILFVVGDGLIYLLYGRGPALMGLVCLGSGLIPVAGLLLFFTIAERIVRGHR
ncbi:MAG: hypothetical protein R6U57_10120 [Anaerolineales bacterium]